MKRDDDKRFTSLQGIFGLNLHNTYMTHTVPIISVSTLSILQFFCTVHCDTIMQHKAKKCTIFRLMYLIWKVCTS
jgi:hypothetical protein